MTGIEIICSNCGVHFSCCRSCWRGHKYCGEICRISARKIKQRAYEKKYAATFAGMESRRKRQKNFRRKNKNSSLVTDQTMDQRSNHDSHAKKKVENKSFHCIQCQCSILNIVNESEGHGFSNKYVSEKNYYFSFARFMSKNY